MTELSLPASVDYSKKLPQLPDGTTSTLMSVQSTNGITFTQGQTIQFDLPSRSGLFIDGKSVFIRYRCTYTSGATQGVIKRKPVFTNFVRLDEFIGSTPVNSVYQYNQVANMWIDTNCNWADIYGQQTSYGLSQTVAMSDLDGVTLATASAANEFYLSAPLVCSFLTGADKLIPTGAMAPIRIQLTLDTIANIATIAANVTNMVITQPEICFQAIDMGSAVENAVLSAAPKIYIKSQGWANASQSLASGTNGFNTLVYNHRYESIDNLFLLSSSNAISKAVNTWGDSFNPLGTANVNASIQFQIAQAVYPQLPINNATGGLTSVLQYLRECVGQITDQRNTMSIFNANFSQYAGDATVSTVDGPAKFIVGIPLSRLNPPSPYAAVSLMSGVSAASTPINVLLNVGTAFNSAMNFNLIAQYTLLVEVDVMSKQIQVIC
jgi:hypothetical protein